MRLAIFDLDHTLLADDSDYLWGQFLVEQGLVDGSRYTRENRRFFDEYKAGRLDIHEFARFSLEPLVRLGAERLAPLRAQFVQSKIDPVIAPLAPALLERHRLQGDTLLIITATNRFITEPIAERFGVDDLLATEPEQVNGRYTGRIQGAPCFREGKQTRLQQWLSVQTEPYSHLTFYSDSHNDLPLLTAVHEPVAVDPDPELRAVASRKGWPVISLRGSLPSL